MSERYQSKEVSSEVLADTKEHREHRERLQDHIEKNAEKSTANSGHEQAIARHEIKEHAISGNEYHKPHSEQRQHQQIYTKVDKQRSFDTTMHHVRNELRGPERILSKFIHKPVVEKASEVVGSTIARPSGIAGATITAFFGLLSVYGIARFAGFELSGSEMPILLLLGFTAGLLIEWMYKIIRSLIKQS